MSHMVIYRSVDGKPGFQQTDDLVSAVEFVERLRNAEGVESARIYRLEQVNFRFQPYYQVHLDNAEAPTAPPLKIAPAAEAAPSVVSPVTQVAPATPAAPLVSAPAATAEAAPTPPPVPSAAMAAAAAEPAPSTPESTDGGAPTLGATPAPEPAEGNGIRRGLFGR